MPTDRQQTCKKQGCHRRFTKPQGTRRIYCFECSPEGPAKKSNLRYFRQNGSNIAQIGENPGESGEDGLILNPLTQKSEKRLDELGVLDTWQAEAVLVLARQIDAGKGGGSAGVAGAIKAHREAMAVAEAISNVEKADVIEMIFAEES